MSVLASAASSRPGRHSGALGTSSPSTVTKAGSVPAYGIQFTITCTVCLLHCHHTLQLYRAP